MTKADTSVMEATYEKAQTEILSINEKLKILFQEALDNGDVPRSIVIDDFQEALNDKSTNDYYHIIKHTALLEKDDNDLLKKIFYRISLIMEVYDPEFKLIIKAMHKAGIIKFEYYYKALGIYLFYIGIDAIDYKNVDIMRHLQGSIHYYLRNADVMSRYDNFDNANDWTKDAYIAYKNFSVDIPHKMELSDWIISTITAFNKGLEVFIGGELGAAQLFKKENKQYIFDIASNELLKYDFEENIFSNKYAQDFITDFNDFLVSNLVVFLKHIRLFLTESDFKKIIETFNFSIKIADDKAVDNYTLKKFKSLLERSKITEEFFYLQDLIDEKIATNKILVFEQIENRVKKLIEKTKSENYIRSVSKLIFNEISFRDFDSEPNSINLKTGTINFPYKAENGQIEDFVFYPKEADTSFWEQPCKLRAGFSIDNYFDDNDDLTKYYPNIQNFLLMIFDDNIELVNFIKMWLSILLTEKPLQKFVYFYGTGRNGKSTLIALIKMLLGDYFSTIDSNLLTMQKGDDRLFQNEMANKISVRALGSTEFAQNVSLNSSLIKSVTGGDQLTARYMHSKHVINFTPKFKVFLFGNFLPRITDATEGIWRRALYVPMNVDIATKTEPREMGEVLAEFEKEMEPFVIHLMHYYKEFLKNGLVIPKAIADFNEEEKIENDILHDFLTANFEEGTDRIPTDEIYRLYKEYCNLQGEKPTFFNSRSLTSALKERGFTIAPGGKNKRHLMGMRRLYDLTSSIPNTEYNQF